MEAHADDLRAEVADPALADRVKNDWRSAGLSAADAALMAFAEKTTREPWTCSESDVRALRAVGLSDEHVSDAVQVIAYFNYINRVADALGVDLEPDMAPRPE